MAMVATDIAVLSGCDGSRYEPEPSIFTCGTCKSVYSSSWFLIQHVQKNHGIKIYEEESSRDSPPPASSVAPIVVKPDKPLLAEQLRKDAAPALPTTPASLPSPYHSKTPIGNSRQRSPSSATSPRGASGGDMFSYPTPYMPGAPRQPLTSAWPFARPHMGQDFAAMMHPELMMDQLRRFQQGLADHSAVPGMPFIRPHASLDTAQYSHSERLRLLAASGGSTSPNSKPLGSRMKLDLPFTSQPSQSTPPSAFTTPNSRDSYNTRVEPKHDRHCQSPNKPQACEFCGKNFHYPSVLAVHRRTHTDEEPFTCPLCDYKSLQASKLRRHWHTTHKSGTVSPDLEINLDIEDTEECAKREEKAEAEMKELLQVKSSQPSAEENGEEDEQDEPTDLSHNSSRRSENSGSPPADEKHNDTDTESEQPQESRTSLLTEVMMNTGLSSLPEYKEAFAEALAEAQGVKNSRSTPVEEEEEGKEEEEEDEAEDSKIEENGSESHPSPFKEEPMDSTEKDEESLKDTTDGEITENGSVVDEEVKSVSSLRRSPPSHPSSDYSGEHWPLKRMKRESTSSAELSPHAVVSSSHSYPPHPVQNLFQRAAMDAAQGLYPGIWFPPTAASTPRDFTFPGFMPRGEHPFLPGNPRMKMDNGLSTGSHHSSAFKAGSNGSPKPPMQSVPSPPGSSSPNSLSGGLARRRNDTCEFCGKIFKNCSNLTVHRRSHTGEKPYKCQLCSYACAQSSKLTRHMRTHGRSGKDVYRCKFCCMPFSVPSTLEKHMRKCVENQQRAAAAAAAASHLSPRSLPAGLPTSSPAGSGHLSPPSLPGMAGNRSPPSMPGLPDSRSPHSLPGIPMSSPSLPGIPAPPMAALSSV